MTLEQLINENSDKLTQNDEYILSFISQNMKMSIEKTVSELAKQANLSDSTLIRLTKKLGFKGYSEFRYFLKEEYSRIEKSKVISSDFFQPSVLVEDVEATVKLFENDKNIERIYKSISQSRKIFAYATGYGQGLMLKEFARCMWNTGIYVIIVPEKIELELISEDISADDMLFVISLSGKTDKVDSVLRKIQLKGTNLVSVTTFTQNKLAAMADVNIYYQVTNINNINKLNNSSFCTLNLVLSLLYEGYVNYQKN